MHEDVSEGPSTTAAGGLAGGEGGGDTQAKVIPSIVQSEESLRGNEARSVMSSAHDTALLRGMPWALSVSQQALGRTKPAWAQPAGSSS